MLPFVPHRVYGGTCATDCIALCFCCTCATVCTAQCLCGPCATVCAVLSLWWHLCYRMYCTTFLVPHVLTCIQHRVHGDTCTTDCIALCFYGTCSTICTALCLWCHLCYRVCSTVSLVTPGLPYVLHFVFVSTCANMCTASFLCWHLCYHMYGTVSIVAPVLPIA